MTEETTEKRITRAERALPSKPVRQSMTLAVQGGGAIFFAFTLLSFAARKWLGFELPFSFDEFSAAVAALIGAGTTLYAIWKRIKQPVQLPIEGTAADTQA